MKIISKHPYNGEYLGTIKKIYKWGEENIFDDIQLYSSSGNLDEYPVCAPIMSRIDYNKLHNEYLQHQDYLINQSGTYLKKWFASRNIPWEKAKEELGEVNFVAEEYRQFNIMELEKDSNNYSQWTKILPWVGEYTKEILSKFKSKPIRARYSIAYPGWHLKPHIDYPHPKTNGFRVHIPIYTSTDVQTFFLIDDEWCEIYFEPGYAWFMNVSVPHKIIHNGSFNRIYLTLDFWSDLDIPIEKQHAKINYLPEEYK